MRYDSSVTVNQTNHRRGNTMAGSVKADFAGTYAEAIAYATEHGFNAPRALSHAGNEGLPMISLPYHNVTELAAVEAKFAEHGWEDGATLITRHGTHR